MVNYFMKETNIIQSKSFQFAVRIVRLHQRLNIEKKEWVLSHQILKSGTSIGANVEESIRGQSERDFFAKLSISYKEARETHFWIRLLFETNYIDQLEAESLLADCDEIIRILSASLRTLKKKLNS
jgi:four helix bundle protein